MVRPDTTHIFSLDAEAHFKQLLGFFHEELDTRLIACGADSIGKNIQQVKMARLGNDEKVCQRIVGSMLKHKPHIRVLLEDDEGGTLFECILTRLQDYFTKPSLLLNGNFFFQLAHHYPKPDMCLYQIWECREDVAIQDINTFWRQ